MGIFNKENTEKANEDAKKKRANKITEPGVYTATLEKVEVKQSKKNNEMVVLTFGFEDYDSIDMFFIFNKEKPDQALKIVGHMKAAFDYEFLPVDAMTDREEATEVANQVKPFIGKTCKAAVTVKEDLFEKIENNVKVVVKFTKPEIWYLGMVGDPLRINKAKMFTPLPPDKLLIWNQYMVDNPHKFQNYGARKDKPTREADPNDEGAVNESFKKDPNAEKAGEDGKEQEDDSDLPFALTALMGIGSLLSLITI